MLFRRDRTLDAGGYASAADYYNQMREAFREKADHNKAESQVFLAATIALTLVTPLFVTLGQDNFWGKIVPAGASVLAAACTAWLQLRKPQRLWAIYRRAQRELEREKAAYDFGLAEYKDATNRDSRLAQGVSEIAFRVHEQWEGLVPEPDSLATRTPSIGAPDPKS